MVAKISERGEKILRETQTPYLVDEEREVLARFLARLESECGDAIRRVILYGSKARGDADEESDVDVVVVADSNAASKVKSLADEHRHLPNVVFNAITFDEEDYRLEQKSLSPFYVNLRREGVELWDKVARVVEESQMPLDFSEGEFRVMDEQTKQVIQHYIGESNRNWIAVNGLRDVAPDIAVSRAYYSAFYWSTAVLYAVNVVRSQRHEVAAALSQFLVKPQLIEEEYKDIYLRLMDTREVVDYYAVMVAQKKKNVRRPTDAEARQLVQDAERFIARLEQFLRERGAIA